MIWFFLAIGSIYFSQTACVGTSDIRRTLRRQFQIKKNSLFCEFPCFSFSYARFIHVGLFYLRSFLKVQTVLCSRFAHQALGAHASVTERLAAARQELQGARLKQNVVSV